MMGKAKLVTNVVGTEDGTSYVVQLPLGTASAEGAYQKWDSQGIIFGSTNPLAVPPT